MNQELKFWKIKKKKFFFWGGGGRGEKSGRGGVGGGGVGLGGQGGCERRTEVFVKIQIQKKLLFGGGGGGGLGGQGGCEQRTEVFVKIQIKKKKYFFFFFGGGGGGVRVDMNQELKFFWKIQKKKMGGRRVGPWGGGRVVGSVAEGVRWGGGGGSGWM